MVNKKDTEEDISTRNRHYLHQAHSLNLVQSGYIQKKKYIY